MTTPEQDLLDTIEEIRLKSFSEIDPDLVKKIVMIEKDYTENSSEALKRITEAIDTYLTPKAGA